MSYVKSRPPYSGLSMIEIISYQILRWQILWIVQISKTWNQGMFLLHWGPGAPERLLTLPFWYRGLQFIVPKFIFWNIFSPTNFAEMDYLSAIPWEIIIQHIQTETKWPPFMEDVFKAFWWMKCINFAKDFTEICSFGSNRQYSSTGSDNGLAPTKQICSDQNTHQLRLRVLMQNWNGHRLANLIP